MPKAVFARSLVKQLWTQQFFRFLVVGAGNVLIGFSLYLAGLAVGLPYQEAVTCGTIIGAIINYFTTGQIVFANDKWHRIFGFLLVYGIVLGVNLGLLTLLVESGMNKALAQALLLLPLVMLSFALNKYLVFRKAP